MESSKGKAKKQAAMKSKQMYGNKIGVKGTNESKVNQSAITSGYFSRDQTIDSNPGRYSEVFSEKKTREK